MSRPIVNTAGQGLASSTALKAAIGAVLVATVVLLIFFALSRAAGQTNGPAAATGAGVSAPAPAAT